MYELVQVSENSYYIESPAKIGLVKLGGDEVCLCLLYTSHDGGDNPYDAQQYAGCDGPGLHMGSEGERSSME